MSLVVSTFWRDPATGDTRELTDWDAGHYMAGVERARRELWGSTHVSSRSGLPEGTGLVSRLEVVPR
jgi:hypothetical protein